ncbi:SAM-dependent methyltransferase [Zhengella mangrovi]|uniref:SAM-dependent methyltransferase n=1 Tax=Zhengella mangrovi TaxID=1982044 RepID=A0A2G1QPU7_9HYPH|nr:cyclopropane-fatty-acyl-phospholipid synthase family protein [Zhengella mangrovi]PHP67515.1 SAM-dependent methyltransferase [Zhengella mangrovi]
MEHLITGALSRYIRKGNLRVTFPSGKTRVFGDGSGLPVAVIVRKRSVLRRMMSEPSLGFAEGFMDGDADMLEGDLLDLLQMAFSNGDYVHMSGSTSRLRAGLDYVMRRLFQINTAKQSVKNVHHHYDLSGELYRLFLDPDLQYSCAYFEHPGQGLADAQLAKKRHIAAKLCIEPGQSVLEVGSGWGGLALYLAKHLNCDVLGVTLSTEQLSVSRQRAEDEGMDDHVRFEMQDYRDVARQFDRIVSVGMFEHVGVNHYRTYFEKIAQLLKNDGVALVHTIGRSGPPTVTDSFIRKYIFPGGYIPALSEVAPILEKTGLVLTDLEVLRLHYAETLKAWRANFLASRDRIKDMYDERFCRMWDFYLAASEAAFRWGDLCVFQFQLALDKTAVPLTRDYIPGAEDALRARDSQSRRRLSRQKGIVTADR